jgi:uncharacterized membrane protein
MAVVTQIQIRRGTASQWTSTNPTLAAGELGLETDTLLMKAGNGSTAWTSLAYINQYALPVLVQNAQTGTTYTLVLTDSTNKLVELSNTAAITVTVPLNSSVAFPVGSQIMLLQTNTGQVTVAGAGGVTINGNPGLKLRAQWSSATIIKRAENTWVLVGDITA